jgi:3-hydroxyacyl-CoA dehydrogenase
MKRRIEKAAVIGSGIMGSGIAAHLANTGVQVLLLDIVPRELNDQEKAKGLSLEDKEVRNRIATENLQKAIKSKPAAFYHKDFAKRIETGNTEDDMPRLAEMDWIIEVVPERLDIKKAVFDQIEKYRAPGSIVSSNTSGIPIHLMAQGRSEDFRKNFLGTHFFNPVRYLKLLEIIPTADTDKQLVDFFLEYGDKYLGKTTVLAKDTPAFIGNRIGVYGIMDIFHLVKDLGLTVEEVDKLTGPIIGRPKSATFRTADLVGLDTLAHVANGLYENVPQDEAHDIFALPDFVNYMLENNMLGDKTGQGFYKKVKKDGKKEILALDLDTMEYRPKQKVKFATLEMAKPIENIKDRYKVLIKGKDKAGDFYRKTFSGMFSYSSHRIPEIADHLYQIDDAMKAGFGWKYGPFEIWDAIGVEKAIEMMEKEGKKPAPWVKEMLDKGIDSFYTVKDGATYYYDIKAGDYKKIPGQDNYIYLDNYRTTNTIWKNDDASIIDLGDGIIDIEFHSKMNTLGTGVIQAINKAIDMAEEKYDGLIIGNQGEQFSVGANLALVLMLAIEQEWDELYMAVKTFQDTAMRVRYSSIPVIVAPHGMTFGGGAEITLHADKVVAAAETYIGLVEFGVGLIPAGGGTKEFVLRTSDSLVKGDVEINRYMESFLTIAMAKVATSAYEAIDLGFLKKDRDVIVLNKDRQIATAKKHALQMAEDGYVKPLKRNDIKVLGQEILGTFMVGTDSMKAGRYISEHDKKIADKLAYVMAGGDLSGPSKVTEDYLIELEREAFLSLLGERKTLERIDHMLKTGKPLRN